MKEYVNDIYSKRFNDDAAERDRVWQVLCSDFFPRFVSSDATVLDLAAGYCEFINNIECGRKIAVDLNPDTRIRANSDIEFFEAASTELPIELEGVVDVVFVSNFFEHLDDKSELMETLREIHRVLRPGGSIIVMQPNIKLIGGAYWDFVDHSLPLTETSLREALELSGFEVQFEKQRFLPYTMKSRIPAHPALVRAYLRFPPAQWLLGKQTLMIGKRVGPGSSSTDANGGKR